MERARREFDIFLSYKSQDHVWVDRLKRDLLARGVRVWLDADQIRPGDRFAQALENGIASSRAVGLVLTPQSVRSEWVREEYYRALSLANQGQLQLIPIVKEASEIPAFLSERQAIDFSTPDKYETNVDRLVWPGITGRRVVFASVHPLNPAPWPDLAREIDGIDVPFLHLEDTVRADIRLRRMSSTPTTIRPVLVIDMFEGDPEGKKNWRRHTPAEYAEFMFAVREASRDIFGEPVFLLYQDPRGWNGVAKELDSAAAIRLHHYFTIQQGLSEQTPSSEFKQMWYRIQRELMQSEYDAV